MKTSVCCLWDSASAILALAVTTFLLPIGGEAAARAAEDTRPNILFAIAMVPEWKKWIKIKKEEKWDDPVEVFQLQGMGRGLIKMARKLGILKKKTEKNIKQGQEET